MKRTISDMAALIVAANALLLTGGVSAQLSAPPLTDENCIFYSGPNFGITNQYYVKDNDWSRPITNDINSVRVRQSCVATFQLYRVDNGGIVRQNSTTVDNPFFYIPTRSRLSHERVRTACVCQDHCIDTTIVYGQERNTNQRSSEKICLGVGHTISIHNLGETTFDNNLGFVTIKAGRWYNYNKGLKPPTYEIRVYQHPGGTGSLLHSQKMQDPHVLERDGRTWWTPGDVKFSASSLYIERTF